MCGIRMYPYTLVVLISLAYLRFCSPAHDQDLEFTELNAGCDGTNTCRTSCISDYCDLELYIKGNTAVIERLKYAFFYPGVAPSRFVKLTYNFKVSGKIGESGRSYCSNRTRTYVWSVAALYLLGPRTLAWLTFFAVDLPQTLITIDLPCLCLDDYDYLLSRLTYMVRIITIANGYT